MAQSAHKVIVAQLVRQALRAPQVKTVSQVRMARPAHKVIAVLLDRRALRAVKVNQVCRDHKENLDSGDRQALQVKT